MLLRKNKTTKYIFVTGGVCSSLGKGIATASIGALMKACGFSVMSQKMDPYLNVDPGTMSPFQHGEVFVTEDGSETDLDLGHYERFMDVNLTALSSVTTGKIYSEIIAKERKFNGKPGGNNCARKDLKTGAFQYKVMTYVSEKLGLEI